MQPSDELIEKFRQTYIQEFGEEITRQQAYEKFLRLANLLRVILRPRPVIQPRDDPLGFSVPGFDHYFQNGKLRITRVNLFLRIKKVTS